MSLATAIAVSAVFAIFGFEARYYLCWFSWSKYASSGLLLTYLALAGGGGGLLGWAVGVGSGASPTASIPLNGVIFGAAGAVALRADFRPRKNYLTADFQQVASVLGLGLRWVEGFLDEAARTSARNYYAELEVPELAEAAHNLSAEINARRDTPHATKKEVTKIITTNLEALAKHDEKSVEAPANLRASCASYHVSEHIAKPSARRFAASTSTAPPSSPSPQR